jgi:hypothetical protein
MPAIVGKGPAMKVTIDRDLCNHVLPTCERCLGLFLRNPLGEDRPCITDFVDDGDPLLTLMLRYDRGQHEVLVLTPEQRELALTEGWSQFVRVVPAMYRD